MMNGNYITVTGVQLYNWYQMGITDTGDLQWLTEFYLHMSFPLVGIQFSIQEMLRYKGKIQ